jgi:hypothetical protein
MKKEIIMGMDMDASSRPHGMVPSLFSLWVSPIFSPPFQKRYVLFYYGNISASEQEKRPASNYRTALPNTLAIRYNDSIPLEKRMVHESSPITTGYGASAPVV